MAGSAPRMAGESALGVALVVGAVVVAIGLMELAQTRDRLVERRRRGKVEHERADLGAKEVVGARRAESRQARQLLPGAEVEHRVGVGEMAHLRVGRSTPTRG